jgi:quercetin dioxygenase-like cupin family protein
LKHLLPSLALVAFATLAPFSTGTVAEESQAYAHLLTPILATGTDVLGQPIVYPQGTPHVTIVVVEIAPGKDTGWHMHSVPLVSRVLEGEVTIDYGSKGIKTFKAGEMLVEAMNWPHNGMNKSDQPLKILAVYFGAEGVANAETAAAPK